MLLVYLIAQYERNLWDLPEVDPVELIKIRMGDFGYNAATLAKAYGDRGTISKVLNYKQSLSFDHDQKIQSVTENTGRMAYKGIPLKKSL